MDEFFDDDESEIIHVYPQFGKEHNTDGQPCWCDPETERFDNGNAVVIHRVAQ